MFSVNDLRRNRSSTKDDLGCLCSVYRCPRERALSGPRVISSVRTSVNQGPDMLGTISPPRYGTFTPPPLSTTTPRNSHYSLNDPSLSVSPHFLVPVPSWHPVTPQLLVRPPGPHSCVSAPLGFLVLGMGRQKIFFHLKPTHGTECGH